jgi:hypothetical protein
MHERHRATARKLQICQPEKIRHITNPFSCSGSRPKAQFNGSRHQGPLQNRGTATLMLDGHG